MSNDLGPVILALRIGLILILYGFLLAVVAVVWRELQVAGKQAEQPRRPLARLIVIESGEMGLKPGDSLDLQPITNLGRSLSNAIVLPDSYASSEHALLTFRKGQWWVEDLNSRNGTFVNDDRLTAPTVIGNGDVLRIGQVRMRLATG
ncbi:MAG: hypothetical protein A2Z04_05680 [Chloroflexi bacterium RBG_16_57_9]|nr:MAG: hypothetical protein A2Z04_05680 [Chloroflexi bacterium RBG_16_57_9]